MANWIICEYHGAKNGFGPNNGLPINDAPINLDLVESIDRDGETALKFLFQRNPSIVWNFINRACRDLEFERILALIKETTEIVCLA
jgi:hypothetical protein